MSKFGRVSADLQVGSKRGVFEVAARVESVWRELLAGPQAVALVPHLLSDSMGVVAVVPLTFQEGASRNRLFRLHVVVARVFQWPVAILAVNIL